VHSYYVTATGTPFVIDPMLPDEGFDAFRAKPPAHSFLTNRHHYRASARFRRQFGTQAWVHRAGLHEFGPEDQIEGFSHDRPLPGGVTALRVGALTAEETAFLVPLGDDAALAIGDALTREGDHLAFMPDWLLGDQPEAVKRALTERLRALLRHDFTHLLLAHGGPWVGGGRDALRRFVGD
jgi:hypothetical protein